MKKIYLLVLLGILSLVQACSTVTPEEKAKYQERKIILDKEIESRLYKVEKIQVENELLWLEDIKSSNKKNLKTAEKIFKQNVVDYRKVAEENLKNLNESLYNNQQISLIDEKSDKKYLVENRVYLFAKPLKITKILNETSLESHWKSKIIINNYQTKKYDDKKEVQCLLYEYKGLDENKMQNFDCVDLSKYISNPQQREYFVKLFFRDLLVQNLYENFLIGLDKFSFTNIDNVEVEDVYIQLESKELPQLDLSEIIDNELSETEQEKMLINSSKYLSTSISENYFVEFEKISFMINNNIQMIYQFKINIKDIDEDLKNLKDIIKNTDNYELKLSGVGLKNKKTGKEYKKEMYIKAYKIYNTQNELDFINKKLK